MVNEIIFENRTDLANHPYCIVLDIKELHAKTARVLRRTRVVNIHDNVVGEGYTWQGPRPTVRRAIQDIGWSPIIRGRVLLVGDMNAHSPNWNPRCTRLQNAGPLEELIDTFELIVNNNTDIPTRPASQGVSIIDLALTTGLLGPLTLWEIPEEYPSLSDHELILLQWEDLPFDTGHLIPAVSTGWNIRSLLNDKTLLKVTEDEWRTCISSRPYLTFLSIIEDLNHEVKWFEEETSRGLDKHAKITRVTSYSKIWWNDDVANARKTWAKEKRKFSGSNGNTVELKRARNIYHRVIRKAKRVCWQKFLQGEDSNTNFPQAADKIDAGLPSDIRNLCSLKQLRL